MIGQYLLIPGAGEGASGEACCLQGDGGVARAQEEEGDCGLEQEQGGKWHFLDQVLPESRLGSLYFWLQQELKVSQTTKCLCQLSLLEGEF